MAKQKQKYYVVWKGKETGVFDSWEECKRQIHGIEGAEYKSFTSRTAAEQAFEKPSKEFIGKERNIISELSPEQLALIGKPIAESICVDAAYNGKEMEYRGVYTKTKKVLFQSAIFEDATNNTGEFLAIVHALALLKKQTPLPSVRDSRRSSAADSFGGGVGSGLPVYSDSATAIHWVRQKHANTKLKPTPQNKSLFYLIGRAEKWLNENKYPNRLLKWETRAWGENLADFGRK